MKSKTKATVFIFGISLSIFSQNIQLSGKVLKPNGSPLKNCTVSLRNANIRTTTNSSGEYTLKKGSVGVTEYNSSAKGVKNKISITGNKLGLSLSKPENVKASLFNIQGKNITTWSSGKLASGVHSFSFQNILPRSVSTGVYILKIETGTEQHRYMLTKYADRVSVSRSLSNSMKLVSGEKSSVASTMAVIDTIDFKAPGYKSKAFTISEYVMECQDVTLETVEDEYEFEPVTLTPSLLKGKWACIFYDQDGCENYITINNYAITNMSFSSFINDQVFAGSWGTYELAGGILDEENLLLICSREDVVFNYQDIRIIALTQSHPNDLLAGSVFSGTGIMGRFNLTTGAQLCMGSFSIMMVRDFTDIGGTSSTSGSTYNPGTSGFESRQNDCLNNYLNCSKACSIGIYGPESTDRYSACIAKCNDERDKCER